MNRIKGRELPCKHYMFSEFYEVCEEHYTQEYLELLGSKEILVKRGTKWVILSEKVTGFSFYYDNEYYTVMAQLKDYQISLIIISGVKGVLK